ncbi:MAG: carbonate dehydratase [Cyclonatronaceae bacterium]
MENEFSALFEKNRKWAKRMVDADPDFFDRLADKQNPKFLWIGCSDSRVPSNQITGTGPGELFVHRNIANMVHQNDINMLSVLQYSVEVLKVRHILLCGHYSCGGVKASLDTTDHGLVDNWIRPLKQIYEDHRSEFEGLPEDEVVDRLCEWNVRQQVQNIGRSTIVQKAWRHGKPLTVHGVIYSLEDGKLQDMDCSISDPGQIPAIYHVR